MEEPESPRRRSSQWYDIRRRFVRNRMAVVGLAMVVVLFLVAIFAPLIAPYEIGRAAQDLTNTKATPSRHHLFGTDATGRDLFSRTVFGTRYAIAVGLAVIAVSVTIGVVVGAVAGYFGKAWDAVLMRFVDAFLAFPVLIGAILFVTVFERGLWQIILAIAIFSWATAARLLRASVLSARSADYVEAARAIGASRWRILTRHILPNSLTPVLIYGAVSVPGAMIAQAALSFLGVGLKAGTPDWGQLISDGQGSFGYRDHLWFFPSLALVFTTLAFVLLADGLRDALDPRLRGS